jgi:acetyltransferase
MSDRIGRLEAVFNPRSVALLGASGTPMSLGNMVYGNLHRDFPGTLYPVNPRSKVIMGDVTYPDVTSLPDAVDLVIFLVPAAQVPDAVEQSIARGHRAGYIITSGFSEAGTDEGRALQARLTELARSHDFPIVGPNCIGFMNNHRHVMGNFSLMPDADRPEPGPVALVSQSGGFGSYILNRAVNSGVKVGLFASTGNECDVNVSDVLRYAVEQPEIRVIGMFSEAIRDPALFIEAADRAAELGKTIISVTPEQNQAVARAAFSHTASIVGSDQVYDTVCRQHRILRAESIDDMLDDALVLQDGRKMKGRRIGVITPSGGAGVLIASNLGAVGLEMPELSPESQARLQALIPVFGSARNPVDTTAAMGSMPQENSLLVHQLLAGDEVIDAVLSLTWSADMQQSADVTAVREEVDKPIVPVLHDPEKLTARTGMPAFNDPTRAVRALAAVAHASEAGGLAPRPAPADAKRVARARSLLAAAAGQPFVLESTAKDVLGLYGIQVCREVVCRSEDEAVKAAQDIGGMVAVKALSYALPHKSDVGGLVLGVSGEDQVRAAYRTVSALASDTVAIDSVLIQQMVKPKLELALGLQRDPVFGPVVAVGLGGILVEILGSAELLHVPFTAEQARTSVAQIAGGRISHPARGLSPAQLEQLAAAVTGLGQLAAELPEIESADINPVMVTGTGLIAVDALLVVRAADG